MVATTKLWIARAIIVLIVLPVAIICDFAEEFAHAGKLGWLKAKTNWASLKELWPDPWAL